MKLPNAEKAVVGREKIANYLLNPAHPDNGGKADFSGGWDFGVVNGKRWRQLFWRWHARRK